MNRQNIVVTTQRAVRRRPKPAPQQVPGPVVIDFAHRARTNVVGRHHEMPDFFRRASTSALILGGAQCVEEDVGLLEAVIDGFWPGLVIAVNDVGVTWPRRIDHWVTLHPEFLLSASGWRNEAGGRHGWLGRRLSLGLPFDGQTWCHSKSKAWETDHRVTQWSSGSSGLLAVTVAVDHLGCDAVVLCGVPMDERPHSEHSVKHDPARPWHGVRSHRGAWGKAADRLRPTTRSMSGWTRDLLGTVGNGTNAIDLDLYRCGSTDDYVTPWGTRTDRAGAAKVLGVA